MSNNQYKKPPMFKVKYVNAMIENDNLLKQIKEMMAYQNQMETQGQQQVNELKEKLIEKESYCENLCNFNTSIFNKFEASQQEVRELKLKLKQQDEEKDPCLQRLHEKESEIEELSVKYSDALLDQEATKRLLTQTSESLEKETLLLQAVERELDGVREELSKKSTENINLESSIKEPTHKLIHIEDALSCEEAAAIEAQDKLKKEKEESEILINCLNKEKQSLQSSNEGFMSQINMLKIGMTKKSVAVEEMQSRIETLREEKNNLLDNCCQIESILNEKESMLKDLQNEFEGRLKIITDLQIELAAKVLQITVMREEFEEKIKARETKIDNLEEEKSNILYKVSHLENHLKKEQDESCNYKTKLDAEQKRSETLVTELKHFNEQNEFMRGEINYLQETIEHLKLKENQLNKLEADVESYRQLAESLTKELDAAHETEQNYLNKIKALEDSQDQLIIQENNLRKDLGLLEKDHVEKQNLLSQQKSTLKKKDQEVEHLTMQIGQMLTQLKDISTANEKILYQTQQKQSSLIQEMNEKNLEKEKQLCNEYDERIASQTASMLEEISNINSKLRRPSSPQKVCFSSSDQPTEDVSSYRNDGIVNESKSTIQEKPDNVPVQRKCDEQPKSKFRSLFGVCTETHEEENSLIEKDATVRSTKTKKTPVKEKAIAEDQPCRTTRTKKRKIGQKENLNCGTIMTRSKVRKLMQVNVTAQAAHTKKIVSPKPEKRGLIISSLQREKKGKLSEKNCAIQSPSFNKYHENRKQVQKEVLSEVTEMPILDVPHFPVKIIKHNALNETTSLSDKARIQSLYKSNYNLLQSASVQSSGGLHSVRDHCLLSSSSSNVSSSKARILSLYNSNSNLLQSGSLRFVRHHKRPFSSSVFRNVSSCKPYKKKVAVDQSSTTSEFDSEASRESQKGYSYVVRSNFKRS